MKKTRLQAYLDFITQVHKLKSGKKTETIPHPVKKRKIRTAIIMLLMMSVAAQASLFSINNSGVLSTRIKNNADENVSPPNESSPVVTRIELVSFTASLGEGKVEIEWLVQKDILHTTYYVERSADDETYTVIGKIESAGNYDQRFYKLIDESPLAGISYYRLVQSDPNGNTRKFPAFPINNLQNKKYSVYPNPASSGKVTVSGLSGDHNIKITVRDLTGKTVPVSLFTDEEGVTSLVIDERIASWKGIFIISFDDGKSITQQKLVIR